MCTGLAVATQASDLGEIKVELVLKPVDCVTGATSEHTNQIVAREFTSLRDVFRTMLRKRRERSYGFLGVLKENLCIVGNTDFLLGLCTRTVDT